jgi:hypothetical protein
VNLCETDWDGHQENLWGDELHRDRRWEGSDLWRLHIRQPRHWVRKECYKRLCRVTCFASVWQWRTFLPARKSACIDKLATNNTREGLTRDWKLAQVRQLFHRQVQIGIPQPPVPVKGQVPGFQSWPGCFSPKDQVCGPRRRLWRCTVHGWAAVRLG